MSSDDEKSVSVREAKRQAKGEEKQTERPDPGPCPIVALGHRFGRNYFLNKAGELIVLSDGEITELRILGLFGGKVDWLIPACPSYANDGSVKEHIWNPKSAARILISNCFDAGIFDPNTPSRGIGVWRRNNGDLIVHCGHKVLIDGAWRRAGFMCEGSIFAAAPTCDPPADEAATAKEGRQLLTAIKSWEFEKEFGAEVVLGFMGAAMLGGAPAWRVHLLTIGRRGTGKSWLADLVIATLGAAASDANNVSEAGMRQSMTGEARAMILDESESDEHAKTRIQQVIQLLRLMASGEGAKYRRGSSGGVVHNYTVTGCAYLSAILPPALKPQDRSRISVVEMKPIPAHESKERRTAAQESIDWATRVSTRLRARAIAGWGRFQDTFEAYRECLMDQVSEGRDADRIATILAGRDLLTCDDVPEGVALREEVERFQDLIFEAAEQADEGEGEQCLTHLLSTPVDLWRNGERETVAEILLRAMGGPDKSPGEARKMLRKIGLRLEYPSEPATRLLLVANQHTVLSQIFRSTRWDDGTWRQALRYLPGAGHVDSPLWFAGVKQRATAIPAEHLPTPDDSMD